MFITPVNKSNKIQKGVNKLANFEMLFLLLFSIMGIIPFYSAFKESPVVYIMKYIILAFFLMVIFMETKNAIDSRKVIVFCTLMFLVSILNTPYILEHIGSNALILSIGYTGMFVLVGVFSMFYFTKIPFNIFKQILLTFFIGVLFVVIIPNIFLVNDSSAFYFQSGRLRFTGVFENPNEMSRFALLNFFLVLRLWSLYKNKLIKFLFFISALFSIYLIYLSDSRTSLIVCFLMVALVCIIKIYKKTPLLLFLGIFLISGATLIGGAYYYLTTSASPFNSINFSELMSGRTDIWQSIFNTTNRGLVFGTGSLQEIGIHNGYIEIIKYYGIIGFAAWMLTLLTILKRKIKFTFKNKTFSNLIGLGIVLNILIYHMLEGALFSFGNLASIYLWLEIAQVNVGK